MPNRADEIVVAAQGKISVAPYGTALPTDPTAALAAAFRELGYVDAAGVTFTYTPSVTDITSWQSATPTRRVVTARAMSLAFQMQQWNMETFAVAFGADPAACWSQVAPGKWRFDPPADTDPLVDYSMVLDAQDGTENQRWVIMRGNIADAVTSNFTRTAAALLPVTFNALAADGQTRSWYFVSDAVQFSQLT